MTAFLKALGYVGPSGVNAQISSRMGSQRFHHPEVPGHSILVYHDKNSGQKKFMSTPADGHPKHTSTQSFDRDFDAVKHGAGHMLEKVPLKRAFGEGYVKKYRHKPLHAKKYTRKKSLLRNGTELRSFSDFMGESTPRSVPPGAWPSDAHEVNWLKNKISGFESEYTAHAKGQGARHGTKPRSHTQIMDLERQIKERGGVPDNHPWIKRD